MLNTYIIIFILLISIIVCLLCYYISNKNKIESISKNKLENIQNNIDNLNTQNNELYKKLKLKLKEILLQKYTISSLKNNKKLNSNFESMTNCFLNKILKYVDLDEAYFMTFDNFDKLYQKIYKKDPTIYNCFNEKQLKAIKFLRDRISNTDIDSIIEYVKKNIKNEFTNCKDHNCFSEKEYIILNNYK